MDAVNSNARRVRGGVRSREEQGKSQSGDYRLRDERQKGGTDSGSDTGGERDQVGIGGAVVDSGEGGGRFRMRLAETTPPARKMPDKALKKPEEPSNRKEMEYLLQNRNPATAKGGGEEKKSAIREKQKKPQKKKNRIKKPSWIWKEQSQRTNQNTTSGTRIYPPRNGEKKGKPLLVLTVEKKVLAGVHREDEVRGLWSISPTHLPSGSGPGPPPEKVTHSRATDSRRNTKTKDGVKRGGCAQKNAVG